MPQLRRIPVRPCRDLCAAAAPLEDRRGRCRRNGRKARWAIGVISAKPMTSAVRHIDLGREPRARLAISPQKPSS